MTTDRRPQVLAQLLTAALKDVVEYTDVRRIPNAHERRRSALASIGKIAEELETLAAAEGPSDTDTDGRKPGLDWLLEGVSADRAARLRAYIVAHEKAPDGPRTYQSAWQFGPNDTAVLLTAEDWLIEEADVDASLDGVEGPEQDTGPERSGILKAIATEIATLRRERSQWAEAATRAAIEPGKGATTEEPSEGEMLAWLCDHCIEIDSRASGCRLLWTSDGDDTHVARGTDYRDAIRSAMKECAAIEQAGT